MALYQKIRKKSWKQLEKKRRSPKTRKGRNFPLRAIMSKRTASFAKKMILLTIR